MTKLVTRADRFHLHKLCGTVCLLNMARHGISLLVRGQFEPFDRCLIVHAVLALSSRSFYVTRHAEDVTAGHLTEEIRWHALLFTLRNISFVGLDELTRQSSVPPEPRLALFAAVALPFHLAVDAATRVHGKPGCGQSVGLV